MFGCRAVDLEFYFVFKEVNGAALLLEDNKITKVQYKDFIKNNKR